MKKKLFLVLAAAISMISGLKAEDDYGVYKTKEDFENNHVSIIGVILSSENYNVGELNVQLKDKKVIKINCNREHYFGFHYLDGNDYIRIDDIFGRVVISGNITLLMSPKGNFKVDENENYNFTPAPNGNLSFYFIKDLAEKNSSKFERLINDDKPLMQQYKNDKSVAGDPIQKQLKYIKIYNSTLRMAKKKKAGKSKKKKHKK